MFISNYYRGWKTQNFVERRAADGFAFKVDGVVLAAGKVFRPGMTRLSGHSEV